MSMYTIVIYIQYGIGKSRLTKTFGLYQSYLKRLILRHALNPQSIIKANLKKKSMAFFVVFLCLESQLRKNINFLSHIVRLEKGARFVSKIKRINALN